MPARGERLSRTRPTAVNLAWALDEIERAVRGLAPSARADGARERAEGVAREDIALCRAIGDHGLALIRALVASKKGSGPINILTHCNAGWLATVDYGTATAAIYAAHDAGVPVHVWVDETRPRNTESFAHPHHRPNPSVLRDEGVLHA